jgi:ATP-dependent 26S proteasome regulatory subunit
MPLHASPIVSHVFRRDANASESERQVTARLMCLLDGLSAGGGAAVVVLATTSRAAALDPALRRPGRLDVEVIPSNPGPSIKLQPLLLPQTFRHKSSPFGLVNTRELRLATGTMSCPEMHLMSCCARE